MNVGHWKLDTDENHILWLTLDRENTSVNSLNGEVIQELNTILDDILNNASLKGLVIQSAKSSGFIAGADISEFKYLDSEQKAFELIRKVQQVFDKLENLPIPTVALIHGFCLGGGMELALACDYRVALDDPKTKLGLPEVKLGLQPGWGGTVRMVRLIGVIKAMPLMLAGKVLDARSAAKLGIVDAAVAMRVFKRAANYYVTEKPFKHKPLWWERLFNQSLIRPLLGKYFYKELSKKVKKQHYPAPYAIIKRWIVDGAQGEKSFINEAKSISQLMLTPTSRNLVRVFFLQTRMKSLSKGSQRTFKHVHVVGAGTMGGDIASWCALRGLQVTLQDRAPEFIAPAIKRGFALFQKKFKKDKAGIRTAMDRITPDVNGLGIKSADLVIEAISENLEAKQKLYQMIEPQLKSDAILATNTSSLPLDELNQALSKPDRLVGIHFFNPVALMQLVEVVSGNKTNSQVVQDALAFIGQVSRLPLPVKSHPGFLVNRILMPYLMESVELLSEGVPAPAIDKAAVDFGMPMGPIELADIVGLDICLSVAEILTKHLGGTVPERLKEIVARGKLGRKTGEGFYRFKKGKPLKPLYKGESAQRDVSDRLILRMLNEAVACLREEVVEDADLLDAGMIFGTGFAPFRGGPMQYAKEKGESFIFERLEQLEKQYGERFKPDQGWKQVLNAGASSA